MGHEESHRERNNCINCIDCLYQISIRSHVEVVNREGNKLLLLSLVKLFDSWHIIKHN